MVYMETIKKLSIQTASVFKPEDKEMVKGWILMMYVQHGRTESTCRLFISTTNCPHERYESPGVVT
jgi:hypothetical protein